MNWQDFKDWEAAEWAVIERRRQRSRPTDFFDYALGIFIAGIAVGTGLAIVRLFW